MNRAQRGQSIEPPAAKPSSASSGALSDSMAIRTRQTALVARAARPGAVAGLRVAKLPASVGIVIAPGTDGVQPCVSHFQDVV